MENKVDSALDLTGARLRENVQPGNGGSMHQAPSIELPNQDAQCVAHIALDIGGSLIKLVYFSPDAGSDEESATDGDTDKDDINYSRGASHARSSQHNYNRGGRLHFVKFETAHVEEAIAFIEAKGLHRVQHHGGSARIKATGGGAYRYADLFRERLGVVLEKEDEMTCLVSGCNFLLKAIMHEAFTYENGATHFVPTNKEGDLYPYLLVNIGSGVSMVKVTGEGQSERVSGSSLGGGTFWGLCNLLTGLKNFDDMLELSIQGDNANRRHDDAMVNTLQVDMLVGDIYGGRDYSNIGLSASTIASSFGKVISQDKSLRDYDPADICMALCRMVSYNIGQLAYLNAMRYGIKRIFFGGFFIRGHPYTMETISYAIKFWSKGDMAAMFLRHEGFLGAVGAFLLVQPSVDGLNLGAETSSGQPSKVRARFVERFSMGAPLTGGSVVGPAIGDLQGKISWVEKFVTGGLHVEADSDGGMGGSMTSGRSATGPGVAENQGAALSRVSMEQSEHAHPMQRLQVQRTLTADQPVSPVVRMALHVGVLHYSPGYDVFPLLAEPAGYEPNTLAPLHDEGMQWWLELIENQIPTVVAKASASQGNSEQAQRRAAAFGRALGAHIEKLRTEPGAYGAYGLAELLELREECLREFGFNDVYKADKNRENLAALQVLPDLLTEIDAHPPGEVRWLSLIEGALAANIFDWGANACVALYKAGTILDIYREARSRLQRRPWALDDFDAFVRRLDGGHTYKRVMMFVDNAGADIVLGQLPIAREFLRSGSDVVMVANKLPAINDVTVSELEHVLDIACKHCEIIQAARAAGDQIQKQTGGRVPPGGARGDRGAVDKQPRLFVVDNGQGSPCINFRRVSNLLAEAAQGTDLIIIEGMGRAIHTNFKATFKCDALLLAMIKTERLAKHLFGESGSLYDCVCKFTKAPSSPMSTTA